MARFMVNMIMLFIVFAWFMTDYDETETRWEHYVEQLIKDGYKWITS